MRNGKSEQARAIASDKLLDRSWGKATQPVAGDKNADAIKFESTVNMTDVAKLLLAKLDEVSSWDAMNEWLPPFSSTAVLAGASWSALHRCAWQPSVDQFAGASTTRRTAGFVMRISRLPSAWPAPGPSIHVLASVAGHTIKTELFMQVFSGQVTGGLPP
jgi:hypothetical protein